MDIAVWGGLNCLIELVIWDGFDRLLEYCVWKYREKYGVMLQLKGKGQ